MTNLLLTQNNTLWQFIFWKRL